MPNLAAKLLPRTWSPNQVVAHNLTRARLLRGWTQDQAAEALAPYLGSRLSLASFSAIERSIAGTRVKQFTADELVALSRAFDLPLGWWFTPPAEGAMYTPDHQRTGVDFDDARRRRPRHARDAACLDRRPAAVGGPARHDARRLAPRATVSPNRSTCGPGRSCGSDSATSLRPATSYAGSPTSSRSWTMRHPPAKTGCRAASPDDRRRGRAEGASRASRRGPGASASTPRSLRAAPPAGPTAPRGSSAPGGRRVGTPLRRSCRAGRLPRRR